MSSVNKADSSEDIADFLLRIRELGEKRDQEDEERTRKLEADILQGRKERQARRGMNKFKIITIALACQEYVQARADRLSRSRQINVSNQIFLQRGYPLFNSFALRPLHEG